MKTRMLIPVVGAIAAIAVPAAAAQIPADPTSGYAITPTRQPAQVHAPAAKTSAQQNVKHAVATKSSGKQAPKPVRPQRKRPLA